MQDRQLVTVVPPASDEVRMWMRRVIRGAHYVPQAGVYEEMSASEEAYIVKGMCSALLVSVRAEMLADGELVRSDSGHLHPGPAMPPHPMSCATSAALREADVEVTNAALKYRDARRAYDVATAAVDEANRGQGNSDGATVSLILAACDAREKAGDKMDEARDDLLAAAEALP